MMAATLNEESVEKKLKTVHNTQDSIQSLSLWIIHHKSHHAKIVELWMKVLRKTVHPSHRLTLFYLCNDVVQTCKKKKAPVYASAFREHLREAAALVRDNSVKGKVERIFNIWEERNVYDGSFIKTLNGILNGKPTKLKAKKSERKLVLPLSKLLPSDGKPVKLRKELLEEGVNDPLSPEGSPYTPSQKATPTEGQTIEESAEMDAEESARILAVFKPHEMIEQMTAFRRQEAELAVKVSQLSHLKLDASNLQAIRQLKDRTRGNDFSNQFEDSCTRLEELVRRQTQHLEDQQALLKTLSTSETFYEEQYREAKIVANAYKNFGARINNMKKRLDELKRSMPQPDSPIPSPDVNAPSPENSPPQTDPSYGYQGSNSLGGFQSALNQQNWMYNGTNSAVSGAARLMSGDEPFQESPPLEAPSPEGSPPGLNLDNANSGSRSVGTSLESRLASFLDHGRSSRQTEESNPPVYTPHMPRTYAPKSGARLVADEDGATTPLDDEAPTTPVQDEHASSPPKLHNTPPKKENPIDFLSRLISQTNKAPASKTSTASFLDSLSNLSRAPTSLSPPEDRDKVSESAAQSWANWKAKPAAVASQPPSPPVLFSSPQVSTPTMVPPPPIPLPVPPPAISQLSPPPLPPTMNLNVPPPPPPPFGLAFSLLPPGFQQTSPGQKENWPQAATDHSAPSRATHSSVLKELTPAKDFEGPKAPESGPSTDPDAMDIVSEEEDLDDKGGEGEGGRAEFAQKLKQKTSASAAALKSRVFVPNPERPNLMTLTVQDDLDEDDMNDEDTVVEEEPTSWSSKTHKASSHRSRSRSRSRSNSREKERSGHKHKKKKKHKRSHSDDESRSKEGRDGEDGRGGSVMGSVVKRMDPRGGRHSRDEEDRKYEDKYDRKYDRYEDRRMPQGPRGSRDVKDQVEAYTMAYRDAFFQQYSQGRFPNFAGGHSDARRSSYSKY